MKANNFRAIYNLRTQIYKLQKLLYKQNIIKLDIQNITTRYHMSKMSWIYISIQLYTI